MHGQTHLLYFFYILYFSRHVISVSAGRMAGILHDLQLSRRLSYGADAIIIVTSLASLSENQERVCSEMFIYKRLLDKDNISASIIKI